MAIAFRAASTNTTYTAVTTVTLAAPAGVAATDIVLAVFGSTGLARSSQPSITAPAGWTLVKTQQDVTNFGDLTVFRALGTVSFANAFTIGNGANVSGSCFSLAYTGVDNVTPMDATAVGQNNATSTTETAPSITTVTANAWLVGAYLWFASAGALPTYSLEFGTHRLNGGLSAGRGGSTSTDTCDAAQAGAGASGTKTVTVSATALSSGILVALRPSSPAKPEEDYWHPTPVMPEWSVVTVFG